MLAQVINGIDHNQFITAKELVLYLFGSSGLLTLVFTILSKLFDRSSRVIIMDEIDKIDKEYKAQVDEIKKDVSKMRFNYIDRFAEQKELVVTNKEIAEGNHSELMQVLVGIKKDIENLQRQIDK